MGPLEAATGVVVVATLDLERLISIFTHECQAHPEGYRTSTVLDLERGEIVDQYGARLSA